MYCQNCGHNNEGGSKFCEACGSKLDSSYIKNSDVHQETDINQDGFSNFEDYRKKKKINTNIIIVSVLALIIIGISAVFGVKSYRAKKDDVKSNNIISTVQEDKKDQDKKDKDGKDDLEKPKDDLEEKVLAEGGDEPQDENTYGEGVDSELFSKMIGVWQYTGDDVENPEQYFVRISKTQVDTYLINTDFLFEFVIEKAEVDNEQNKVTLTGSEYPPVMYEEELEYYEDGTYEILSKEDGMVYIKELNKVYTVELENEKKIDMYYKEFKSTYIYSHGLEEGM